MKLSLFWRFYLSLLGAVAVVALCAALAVAWWLQRDNYNDFLRDASHAAEEARRHLPAAPDGTLLQDIDGRLLRAFVERQRALQLLSDSERVFRDRHARELWIDPEGDYHALLPRAEDGAHWVVGDDPGHRAQAHDDGEHTDEDEYDHEELIALLLLPLALLSFAIGMAAALYWLVRRLERPLRELDDAVQQLADGGHQRVREQHPEPVGSLARNFNRMGDSVRRQMEEQHVLSHAIAHELRSPLTRMQLAVGLLQSRQDSAQQAPLLADLERYVDDMAALTERVLALATIDRAPQPGAGHCALGPLLAERLRAHADPRLDAGLCDNPCELPLEPLHARLLIDNLLGNALRHAERSVRVTLQAPQAQRGVVLRIEDDGPGIAAERRSQLLKPFTRADSGRARESGGHGLGLAIVAGVVRRAEAELTLSESPLGGLAVRVAFAPDG